MITDEPSIDVTERKSCPECNNSAKVSRWVFIEEDLSGRILLQCPGCNERLPYKSLCPVDTKHKNTTDTQ